MSLNIEIRHLDQTVILELTGRLSIFETDLRAMAWEYVEDGARNFIIDLAKVEYVDSAGLGQLCWIYSVSKNFDGTMVLLKPTARLKKLLNITKLDTVFKSFDDERDAVESLQPVKEAISA
jgi:anti-sigma B factor antagonist